MNVIAHNGKNIRASVSQYMAEAITNFENLQAHKENVAIVVADELRELTKLCKDMKVKSFIVTGNHTKEFFEDINDHIEFYEILQWDAKSGKILLSFSESPEDTEVAVGLNVEARYRISKMVESFAKELVERV